jgi:hypothetical protein
MALSDDYLAHVAHRIRDIHGRVVGYRMPAGGVSIDALMDRPPFRRLAGKRAVLAGRGRRRSQSPEAMVARADLVLTAWRLRTTEGLSIRQIARVVDRPPSLVGRWLVGIPACGGYALDSLFRSIAVLTTQVQRRPRAVREYDERWAA